MNLNLDSIGTVTKETEEFYAMADKNKVKKYVYGERLITTVKIINIRNKKIDLLLIMINLVC